MFCLLIQINNWKSINMFYLWKEEIKLMGQILSPVIPWIPIEDYIQF